MTYEKYLEKLTDELFDKASDYYTWAEFAKAAGLCYSTVYNLGTRKTRYPQLRTVFKLAKAVGYDLSLVQRRIQRYKKRAA